MMENETQPGTPNRCPGLRPFAQSRSELAKSCCRRGTRKTCGPASVALGVMDLGPAWSQKHDCPALAGRAVEARTLKSRAGVEAVAHHRLVPLRNWYEKGGGAMPKNSKQTSPKAAKAASKVLRDGRSGKASKTAAGSALAQTPKRGK